MGSLPAEERERLGVGTIPVPDWGVTVPHAPLWGNLDRMRGYLDKRGVDPADRVLVAIGWVSRVGFEDDTGTMRGLRKPPYLSRPSRRNRRAAGICSGMTSQRGSGTATSPTCTHPTRARG